MPTIPLVSDATTLSDRPGPRDLSGLSAPQPALERVAAIAHKPDPLDSVVKRQQQIPGNNPIIPQLYDTSGPDAGLVVGIVLGSVVGFLVIAWLLYSLTLIKGSSNTHIAGEEEVVVRRPRRNSHSQRSHRSTHREMREYSRSPRRSGGRSQVIVEERRPPRPRSVMVESRVPGDDVVEVIEEQDEYRSRRGSRAGGRYR